MSGEWIVLDDDGTEHPRGCLCETCLQGPPNQRHHAHSSHHHGHHHCHHAPLYNYQSNAGPSSSVSGSSGEWIMTDEDGTVHPRDCSCTECIQGPLHLRPHHGHHHGYHSHPVNAGVARWIQIEGSWTVIDADGSAHPRNCRCSTCMHGAPAQAGIQAQAQSQARPPPAQQLRESGLGQAYRRSELVNNSEEHHSPHHRTATPRRGILRRSSRPQTPVSESPESLRLAMPQPRTPQPEPNLLRPPTPPARSSRRRAPTPFAHAVPMPVTPSPQPESFSQSRTRQPPAVPVFVAPATNLPSQLPQAPQTRPPALQPTVGYLIIAVQA